MSTTAATARIVPLEWDSAHFGVRVERLEGGARGVGPALAESAAGGVRLVIARVEARQLATVHELEAHGFRLMDTLVRYERALVGEPADAAPVRGRPGGPADRVRPVTVHDASAVREVAREAFTGYVGHFRNDPRLDPDLADRVYVEWAVGQCGGPDEARGMIVAELDGRVVGFGLVVRETSETAEGVLYAVASAARGRGLGGELLTATSRWAQGARCRSMSVHSSLSNPGVHQVWLRAGFAPAGGLYTLHRWSD